MKREHALIPILLLSSSTALATPVPDDQADWELLHKRDELNRIDLDKAWEQKSYFRPLCDADGYPLVGNVMPKRDEATGVLVDAGLQPSEFCAHIRDDQANT